jgi:hypothetical protein
MMTATRTDECPRCGRLLRCHFVIANGQAVPLNGRRCTVRCRLSPYTTALARGAAAALLVLLGCALAMGVVLGAWALGGLMDTWLGAG